MALLKRPPARRRYRSTWAAFMIGKVCLRRRPERAVGWFRYVRRLAGGGYADSLGLASASWGWEARAELRRKDYARAIELYLMQKASGDPTAAMSLRTAAARVLSGGGEAMRKAAGNASARQVVTAYIVARGGPRWSCPTPPGRRLVREWLSAVETAGAKDMPGAERLAWSAYQAGEWDTAARWLARARAESAVAGWIRAKLLLRAGKCDQAAAALARVVGAFAPAEVWAGIDDPECVAGYRWGEYSPAGQAAGELAALRMARSRYADALDLLLRHGWWHDAAYVAERVLTPAELIACVDRHFPEKAAAYDAHGGLTFGSRREEGRPGIVAGRIRHLLARRLTRIGRWKEARKYYPPRWRPRLDAYIRAIRAGNDSTRPAARRAESLWQAARIARHEGMDLLATELSPDWHVHEGTFAERPFSRRAGKEKDKDPKVCRVTADERRRLSRHRLGRERRFHYRYVAADHAWSAAGLMPDESDETARLLCTAGRWIQNRDPKAADRFYKALVRRCGTTKLGREADRLRWFPKMDEKGR